MALRVLFLTRLDRKKENSYTLGKERGRILS